MCEVSFKRRHKIEAIHLQKTYLLDTLLDTLSVALLASPLARLLVLPLADM